MTRTQQIARGHEFGEMAEAAQSPAMARIYLMKAANYYRDGGREDLAELCEGMREAI